MKIAILLSILIFSQISFAALRWENLRKGETYKLNQNLNLNQSGSNIEFKKGTSAKLIEKEGLNMVDIELHKYKIDKCDEQIQETELELIPANGEKASLGVALTSDCILEVYVEKSQAKEDALFL